MRNFASAISKTDTLSSAEMKNVKGGGNCGFQHAITNGKPPRIICDLEEGDQAHYAQFAGRWRCISVMG